jgi:hypothetical protein
MAKQDWEVTIHLTETEGGEDTTLPWYQRRDIEDLITGTMKRSGKMRDLDITRIEARELGGTYL